MPVVNYTNNHSAALVEFVASQYITNSELHELCAGTFKSLLSQPGLVPEENCLLLEINGRIQGLALLFREFPIGRSVIEVMTTPELSGELEELELLQKTAAIAEAERLSVIHICVMPDSRRSKLLEELGFTKVRTYLDMLWEQDELPDMDVLEGYSLRSFKAGDTVLLTKLQNDAFTGSWGFCPNTEDQIEYRTNMPNTSTAGIIFLFAGERPAGYCWTVLVPTDSGLRGIIGMIGVDPDFQGQGVSRHVLHAGMKHLHSIGIKKIGLEVDGNNDPAIHLYTSTGFKKIGERHWFERELPGI